MQENSGGGYGHRALHYSYTTCAFRGRMSVTPQELAQKLLAQAKPYDSCLLWQGQINQSGYAVARVSGREVLVHRYIKMYEVTRTAEQLLTLKKFRTRTCPKFTHCINPKHVEFTMSRADKHYESMPDWQQVYGTGVHGLC